MPIERKLAAIMFTDIAGYTAQMSKDEAVAISLLNKKESILKPLIAKHNGTYVKSTGDGSLSHFNSAVDAATCAKRLQESIYDDKDLNVRVGVHLGDTIFEKGDIRGDGVNIASRLESMAVEGGVFVSKEVHDQLANQKEFEGVSLGLQSMKGVGRLIEVYGLKGEKLNEPNPSEYQEDKVDVHTDDEVPSIAIIPLKNKGDDKDIFYAYGISADLISDVTSAGLIRVASLNNIEKIESYEKLQAEELASKLDVRYTAEGTLWKMGDMFQLSIELYDTKDKKVVWSDRWQEKWDDLPNIKVSISEGILKALDIKTKVEKKIYTTNPKAYELYISARHFYFNRQDIEDATIAEKLIKKSINLDENLIQAKCLLGFIYSQCARKDDALEIYNQGLILAEKNSDVRGVGHCLHNLADIYDDQEKYDKAIEFAQRSLKIAKELEFEVSIAASLTKLGNIFYHKKNYDKAMGFHFKSMKITKKLNDLEKENISIHNIGNIYFDKKNYFKAIDMYNKSISLSRQFDNLHGESLGLLNLGQVYLALGNFDIAIDIHSDSMKIAEKIGDNVIISENVSYIGVNYESKGNYNKSLENHLRALEIYKELNDKDGIAYPLNNIGINYFYLHNYNKSIKYLKDSIKSHQEYGIIDKELNFETHLYLYFNYFCINKIDDFNKIITFIKSNQDIEIKYELNYYLFKYSNASKYLKNAMKKIQNISDNLETDVAAKFLSYPIPRAIVEEWGKINKDKK